MNISSDFSLLALLYLSLGIALISSSYFWRAFPLVSLSLLHTISYYRSLPSSLSNTVVWVPVLVVLGLLFLGLSPLQLLLPPKERKPPKSIEILYEPKEHKKGANAPIDIVAVHGLGSAPERAWIDKETQKLWLGDFLPEALPNARVMTFNHDTVWSNNSAEQELSEYSQELLRVLAELRTTEEEMRRPILFIGYSFGGLIVKRALVIAATERTTTIELVKGIIYLGTPHGGSHMAVFGKIQSLFSYWVGSRTEHLDILRINSDVNEKLNGDYLRVLKTYTSIQHFDFYEVFPEKCLGFKIGKPVPKKYGTIDTKPCAPLEATHRTLHRFPDQFNANYLSVKSQIKLMCKKALDRPLYIREENQRKEVLAWLSHSDFSIVNAEHDRRWTPETCGWICKTSEYQKWNAEGSDGLALYVFGSVGCGKSYIAQYLQKRLHEVYKPVLYFYFDSKQLQSDKNTAISFFRTILHQLLTQTADNAELEYAVFESFRKAYNLKLNSGTTICDHTSISQLQNLFKEILPLFPTVRIVIDALDECLSGPADRDFVTDFISIAASIGTSRVIVTSRPDTDILEVQRRQLQQNIAGSIRITSDVINADISRNISHRVEMKPVLEAVRDELENKLIPRAQGMFLYVRLVMDNMEEEESVREALKTLDNLPKGLEGLYQQALEKLQKTFTKNPTQSASIFHWLITAHRPLKVEGLHMALRADKLVNEKQVSAVEDLGDKFWDPQTTIRKYCFPLVEILADQTVQLVHFSVTEYFYSLFEKRTKSLERFYYYRAKANIKVTLTCLAYLSLRTTNMSTKDGSTENPAAGKAAIKLDPNSEAYDFLSYAVMQWPYHALKAETEASNHRERLLRFCQPNNQAAFSSWVRDRASLDGRFRISFRTNAATAGQYPTPLHIAAYYGLTWLSLWLLEENPDAVNALDSTRATPLHVASEQGSSSVVTQFLKLKDAAVFMNAQDDNKQTALHRAAIKGHLSVVEALLDGNVDVDARDKFGRTALFLASLYGRKNVVDKLLDHKAGLDCASVSGDTPLTASVVGGHTDVLSTLLEATKASSSDFRDLRNFALNVAARKGYTAIAKRLLDSDVDTEAVDNVKQTALHGAATSGHEKVVELLLEYNAKVDPREQSDRTPLYFATEQNHLDIVKQLIKAGANINALDRRNQTVLFKPSGHGHVSVVKELLTTKINVKMADHWGRTALHWSCLKGRLATTEMLLTAGCDMEAKEWEGQTPLHWAAKTGGDDVVPYLLEKGVNTAAKDNYGLIPIHWAAWHGNGQVLEYLIPHSDPNSRGGSQETPLHLAATGGHGDIIERLLSARADVNLVDNMSQTALHRAAAEGHIDAIRILLKANCPPNATDHKFQTSLHIAAREGHEAIIHELMSADPGCLTIEDYKNRKPADRARVKGHISLAKILEERGLTEWQKVLQRQPRIHEAARTGDTDRVRQIIRSAERDIRARDIFGRTALHWSAEGGHSEVTNLLLEAGIDPNATDRFKRTAIHLKNASFPVFESLVRFQINVSAVDIWGQSALHLAAIHGNEAAIRQLISSGADANARDEKKRTPLHRAAENGHEAAVKELLVHGSNVNAADRKAGTPLHIAAKNGRETIIPLLLEAGANQRALDSRGRIPLHFAAGSGNDTVLRQLLRSDLKEIKDKDREAPIHYAAQKGSTTAVIMLLQAGVNVAVQTGLEQTALHIAAKEGHIKTVRYILENSAQNLNLNTRDYWQKTPLQWAAENGHEEILRLLIGAGYDIMAAGDRQDTPLHLAAENQHEAVVDLLLSNGAFVDAALYQTRQTPLHRAAVKGFDRIVQILLKAGATPEALDNRRETPMHHAVRFGYKSVVEELLAFDADPTIKNSAGLSPADIAEKEGMTEIFQLFSRPGLEE